jgi:YHS domain-containing protein
LLAAAPLSRAALAQTATADREVEGAARPVYDDRGELLLPATYREWILVGTSLGLSYSESPLDSPQPTFHNTLIEPSAYRHYRETGSFPDGTMLALLIQSPGSGALPSRQGQYGARLLAVEMAVKDRQRAAELDTETWAYYNFGNASEPQARARALPERSCHACHAEHAGDDNVFTQFYALLEAAPPVAAAAPRTNAPQSPVATQERPTDPPAPELPLALRGLDPVALVEGKAEPGNSETFATAGPYRYRFASAENRERFLAEPARYSIRNDTCVVFPGAPIDPGIFAVHESRLYSFATSDCVSQFTADPGAFVDAAAGAEGSDDGEPQ